MYDSDFQQALERYSRLRIRAYREVELLAARSTGLPTLRLTPINAEALYVWHTAWHRRHPLGYGGWDWRSIVEPVLRRPTGFHLAIWSGEYLCGLAAGRASKRRRSGVRHTLSVHFLESNPDPAHPLRGRVAPIALAGAEAYGAMRGAWRLRLVDPLPGVFRIYDRLGFRIAHEAATRLYFEKRIKIDEPLRF